MRPAGECVRYSAGALTGIEGGSSEAARGGHALKLQTLDRLVLRRRAIAAVGHMEEDHRLERGERLDACVGAKRAAASERRGEGGDVEAAHAWRLPSVSPSRASSERNLSSSISCTACCSHSGRSVC